MFFNDASFQGDFVMTVNKMLYVQWNTSFMRHLSRKSLMSILPSGMLLASSNQVRCTVSAGLASGISMFASPQCAVSSRINWFTWVSQDGSTFQMGVDSVYCLRQRWVCSDRLGLSSVTCVLLCTCAEPGTTYLNSSGLALPSRGNADCLRVQHRAHFNLLFRDCGYTLRPQLTVSGGHLAIKTDPQLLHPHNFVNDHFRMHQYLYSL